MISIDGLYAILQMENMNMEEVPDPGWVMSIFVRLLATFERVVRPNPRKPRP